ncbi:MAG: protein-glutamate O-methyltransferase CheR [Terriglobales bacterium]
MTAGPAATSAPAAPPDPHLSKIRDLIYKAAGIFQPDNKLRLLEDRCGRRLQELKVKTLRDYFDRLNHPTAGREEMTKLLNEITIGETCFFRSQSQLDALKSVALPRILTARSSSAVKKLRIWSAGCSTGEEPYSLAMFVLEESAGLLKGWTFEIQATDLNERSLEHARAGIYGDYSVRNVSAQIRQKYFVAAGDKLQVGPAARKLVSFSRLNLLDEMRMPLMKDMDVIFCANVLIYFDLNSKRKVIEHFYSNLQPHGYFFLGHSESLYGVNDQFKLVHFPSATGYVKSQPPAAGR